MTSQRPVIQLALLLAVTALHGCESETQQLIHTAERGNSAKVRNEACEHLGLRGDTSAVSALIRMLDDPALEWCAAQSLGRLGSHNAVGALQLNLLLADGSGINRMAVWALGQLGDPSSIEALLALDSAASPLSKEDSLAINEAINRLRFTP